VWQFSESPNTCDSIALCTEKGGTSGKGDCLVYLNPAKADFFALKPRQAIYPLPLYEPTNLPKAYVYKPDLKTANMPDGSLAFVLTDFNDKIKSIEISPTGGCLVGLFENKTPFKETGMSRFFDSSVMDLSTDPIGKCGSILSFNRYQSQSCASAVVVYPTIPQQLASHTQTPSSDIDTGFSSDAPFMYNPKDTIDKVDASLKRFSPLKGTLVNDIKIAVANNTAFKTYLQGQKITLKNGNLENIDVCLFVQMLIIQESLGKEKACSVDKDNNAVACGLMQVQKTNTQSCDSCDYTVLSNLNNGIAKLLNGKQTCGNSAVSCFSVKLDSFWPYLIVNYNTGQTGNYKSNDCKEPCSAYLESVNGGCFFPALQVNFYPTRVECPIRRNQYNITYKYVLTMKDGYSYLRQLQTANPTRSDLATCR